jgi:hypothetical protein
VTDRRRPDQSFAQGAPAYHRIMEKVEQGFDAITTRMEARLDRIDRDLAARELDHQAISREMQEIRRDLGELRDSAAEAPDKTAVKVVAAAPEVVKPAVVTAIPKTWWGRVLIAATAFTTLMVAVNNIPDAVRGWDKFWAFLRNEPAAVVRHVEGEKK